VNEGSGGAAGSWTWNGTDRDGRAVPSGIYFVHARDSDGRTSVERSVVVR
jgi:flagellar hook assembly protein FlgD